MLTKSLAVAASMLVAGTALAQDNRELVLEGTNILTSAAAPSHVENLDTIYSGWRFRTSETQDLQLDDFDNPSFVFVDRGIELFETVDGSEGKACSSCHEDVAEFEGLRPTMPKVINGKLETIETLVNDCRENRMGAKPWKYSGADMQSVVSLVGLQSRGMPINVSVDGEAASYWEKGKELYYTRVGQLDMACSNCHEDNYGVMIRADHLSQGQINGFPTYRLKNAKMNSIHGRFKGCMKNIRATPYKEGGEEFKALELYLASRGNGLSVETPSVRN